MNADAILNAMGILDYAALAAVALWGGYCVILFLRQIARRRFVNQEQGRDFLDTIKEALQIGDTDGAVELCESPAHWYRAVPILSKVAIENRGKKPMKIRELIAARFEQEILVPLENLLAWINTVIKTAPMLGLWGTVLGMIGAFSKIASVDRPDPSILAGDIYLALVSTAIGLAIAIPLVFYGNVIQMRMRQLEDDTLERIEEVLDGLEGVPAQAT